MSPLKPRGAPGKAASRTRCSGPGTKAPKGADQDPDLLTCIQQVSVAVGLPALPCTPAHNGVMTLARHLPAPCFSLRFVQAHTDEIIRSRMHHRAGHRSRRGAHAQTIERFLRNDQCPGVRRVRAAQAIGPLVQADPRLLGDLRHLGQFCADLLDHFCPRRGAGINPHPFHLFHKGRILKGSAHIGFNL